MFAICCHSYVEGKISYYSALAEAEQYLVIAVQPAMTRVKLNAKQESAGISFSDVLQLFLVADRSWGRRTYLALQSHCAVQIE